MTETLSTMTPEAQRTADFLHATQGLERSIDDVLARDVIDKEGQFIVQTDREGRINAARVALAYIPGRKNPGLDMAPQLYRVGLTSLDSLSEDPEGYAHEYLLERLRFSDGARDVSLRWHQGESIERESTTPGLVWSPMRNVSPRLK